MSTTTLRAYLDDVAGLLEQQALEEVIGHCRHILQHFPKNLETYRILGQALLEKNRHQEASDVFQRVLGALPDDFKAHIGMSACWEELQQIPRAIWHMERAFEVDPNNRALQDELKRLMERNRQQPPARFTPSRAALARIYFNGKLYEQAINELQGALPQFPDRYDLQVLYMQSLWNAEHVTEATEQALLVLETLPDSLVANRIMAELWLRASRPSDAKPYFIKVEQLDPFVAWDMLHEDGEAVPMDAFKLPRLQWDVRAAAALATGTPDWMANIGEVFVDPEAVDLSIPSEKRKRVWLDDFGAPTTQPPAATGKPRTGGLIDKYAGAPVPPPAPVEEDDAPSWFKEFSQEEKKSKKRSTSLNATPVWDDPKADKGSTPALSGATTADADWLFDGSDEMPPIPPTDDSESLEVRAADALSWLQNDGEDTLGGGAVTSTDANWLFGDDETPAAASAAADSAEMPDTLDWLTSPTVSTPKLNKLPTGDLPAVENSEDALAWLQTGTLSPDALPPEPTDTGTVPAADSAVINDPNDALSWLETGALSPDALPAENAVPDMDWLLNEASVPPVAQQTADTNMADMFLDEPTQMVENEPSTRKIPPASDAVPAAPPAAWSTGDAGDNASDAFAAWLDANPEPAPAPKPVEDEAWISALQVSDAMDADKLKDQVVESPSAVAEAPDITPPSSDDIDEFALLFDSVEMDLNPPPASPALPADDADENPMAWMMDLGLSVPAADAVPTEAVMDDFEPFEQTEQDPLAWMRDAGLEPPPELSIETEATEAAPADEDDFMTALGTDLAQGEETGLDIQSDLFAPASSAPAPAAKAPEPVAPPPPAAEPAPLLDLSDPDWLNDFQPIEVPEDLNLPKTGSLAASAANEGLDWLAAFGTVESPTETPTASASEAAPADQIDDLESVDIGWLNQSAADQVTAMGSDAFAMPASSPSIEQPVVPAPAAVEPPKVEAAADDWLASFGVIADEQPTSPVLPTEVEPTAQSLDDAFSLDALLGDIGDIQPTEMPTAPVTQEEQPASDWLAGFGFDLDTASAGDNSLSAEPAATLEPTAPVDETPDWLTGVAPLNLPTSADVASNAEDFSDFLNAFKDEPPVVDVSTALPQAASGNDDLASLLDSFTLDTNAAPADVSASTDALVGDNTDWLSAFGADTAPAAEPSMPAAPASASMDDDLGSLLDSFTLDTSPAPQAEANAAVDVNDLLGGDADWLTALGSDAAPAAEVAMPSAPAQDDLDSLLDSFVSDPSSVATPEPSLDLGGDNLDWLGGLASTNDAPAATTPSSAANDLDFGGFLNDLSDLGNAEELSSAQQQPIVRNDLTDWMADIGGDSAAPALSGLDALDFSNLPSAEPDAAAPDLSALMADLGVQPDALTSAMSDADDPDLAPAAMPDWMASIAPPTADDEPAAPPSDSDLKRTTTPMDAFTMPPTIEPPSSGPSSTGFTDMLRELKVGARPILPPTGMLPPIEENAPPSSVPAEPAEPVAESDWLAAFAEPADSTLGSGTFDTVGTTTDDDFKLELDAILAPGDLSDELVDEPNSSTASFDIDSVTDFDLGAETPSEPVVVTSNEDWLSSLGFTDDAPVAEEAVSAEMPSETADTQTFDPPIVSVEPVIEAAADDDWFGAMMTPSDEAPAAEETPDIAEPNLSSSMFAKLNELKQDTAPTDVAVDPDAPAWLRDLGNPEPTALESDQLYNAKPVAPTPDSGNTSNREEKPSNSSFALPKRAPRWSRSGKTGDLDPNMLQPRSTQSIPAVPPDVKPDAPPEKKAANAPDDDLSNLLNSLLDDSDSDLSDLLK